MFNIGDSRNNGIYALTNQKLVKKVLEVEVSQSESTEYKVNQHTVEEQLKHQVDKTPYS